MFYFKTSAFELNLDLRYFKHGLSDLTVLWLVCAIAMKHMKRYIIITIKYISQLEVRHHVTKNNASAVFQPGGRDVVYSRPETTSSEDFQREMLKSNQRYYKDHDR